jgi:hypothetical protein
MIVGVIILFAAGVAMSKDVCPDPNKDLAMLNIELNTFIKQQGPQIEVVDVYNKEDKSYDPVVANIAKLFKGPAPWELDAIFVFRPVSQDIKKFSLVYVNNNCVINYTILDMQY